MARDAGSFVCSSCGTSYGKWMGRCNRCGEYGTIPETPAASVASKSVGMKGGMTASNVSRPARRVADITAVQAKRTPTGIGELDRIIGGGLVAGQVVLIAGEPGCGKTTLLASVGDKFAKQGKTVLIVSGEESVEQMGVRARRIGIGADTLLLADETDSSVLLGHVEQADPDMLIVDSIQTIASPDIEGRAGSVSQVVEVAAALTRTAKSRHMVCIIVAQVTKDGTIAGPKYLEHLVDTVLFFEGDKHTSLRLLRVVKNRYGAADEVACFEQTDEGMKEVVDPSGLFLGARDTAISGTCVSVTMEGRRALLAEVQALVSPTNAPNPRRGVSGLDPARMAMLVAITEKHGKLRLYDKDTFLATVGGIRIIEPAVDLPVCLSLASAAWDIPVPLGVAAIGEVALSGDIRSCPNMGQRIAEAHRLGFSRILVPPGTKMPGGMKDGPTLIHVAHLGRALAALKDFNNV